MKIKVLLFALASMVLFSMCAPKSSCGKSKSSYKKKDKQIRSNPNFKM